MIRALHKGVIMAEHEFFPKKGKDIIYVICILKS